MAWISVHGQLRDHSKTRKLAKLLGVNREEAMGILLSLWLWGIDNADRDGFIVDADGIDIEEGINAHVQPAGKLIDSLVKSRWVDIDESGLYCIHDWDEWQESWYTYIDRKRKDAERKRNERRQKAAARPGDSPMDVPVDCPMDRPRTVTRTVTGTVQTSPNVTIPNQTVIKPIENEDDEARARACTRIREISRATTPTAVTSIHDIESDKKLMPDSDRVYIPVPAAEETDRYMPVLVGATESASESDVSAAPDIHARWAFNVLPVADVTTEMDSRPEPEIQPIILREFMPQNPVGGQPAYGGVGPPGDMEAPFSTAKHP